MGTGKTLRAGLIGEHIQATRFPAALQILCDAVDMELSFELIDALDHQPFDFRQKVTELIDARWTGVTATHPFKIDAARFAGAGAVGGAHDLEAANTLVFGDPLKAYNTDYSGFIGAWRQRMGTEKPGCVAMAGAGGVARAIGPALAKLGASRILLWDMMGQKAAELADKIGPVAKAVDVDDAPAAVARADGVVNATALGMAHAPGSAIAPDLMAGRRWAFDAVYTPTNTEFLNAAAKAGLITISGFDLFCHMAIGSFEAYSGHRLDSDDIYQKLAVLKPD